MRLNWESALLILLVLEILLFGAINPRMLDINMLLFSTSDFICIGIVALPLTLVIISGGSTSPSARPSACARLRWG